MLTHQQREEFFERGFTHVAGAISRDVTTTMVSRIWKTLEELFALLLWREILAYRQQPGGMAHAEVVPGERTNR